MVTEAWSNIYYNSSSQFIGRNSRNRTWVRTPDFKTLARGNLPINPYTDDIFNGVSNPIVKILIRHSDGLVIEQGLSFGTDAFFDFDSMDFLPDHRSFTSLENEAMLKALAKVSDAKSNLAVMFAEKAKTSSLILDSATRIFNAMRSFRKGNLKGIAENLNISPSKLHKSWLEYKYGWMPLLMDVKGSAEFLAQQNLGRPPRFTVSSTVKDPISGTITGPGNNRMSFDSNMETATYSSDRVKSVRVKLWLEISNPQLTQLQQLGLTNPALVAWELIPFSFVFDWFISVGSYLQGITALNGVTVRKAMTSWSFYANSSCVESFPGYNGSYHLYLPWSGLLRECKHRTYSRGTITVNPLSLHPPVDFSLPSGQRLISALALMRANSRSFGNTRI